MLRPRSALSPGSVGEEVAARRRVEADRAKPRATARAVTVITLVILATGPAQPRIHRALCDTDRPARAGRTLGFFATALWWMHSMTVTTRPSGCSARSHEGVRRMIAMMLAGALVGLGVRWSIAGCGLRRRTWRLAVARLAEAAIATASSGPARASLQRAARPGHRGCRGHSGSTGTRADLALTGRTPDPDGRGEARLRAPSACCSPCS